MRWLAKVEPRIEDVRLMRRFAWLPTRIDNLWIWMERYTAVEQYKTRSYPGEFGGWFVGWEVISRRLPLAGDP